MVSFTLSRGRRNIILTLKGEKGWIEGVFEIRQEVVKFFVDHFTQPNTYRPRVDGVIFLTFSEDDNLSLITPFNLLELGLVV